MCSRRRGCCLADRDLMRGAPFGEKGTAAPAVVSCIGFFTDNSSGIPSRTMQQCGPRRGPGGEVGRCCAALQTPPWEEEDAGQGLKPNPFSILYVVP